MAKRKGQMKALADVINDENWCRITYENAEGKRCLVGHVKAKWGYEANSVNFTNAPYFGDIIKLSNVICGESKTPLSEVTSWNDAKWRTAREVAELCAKAGV